MNSLKLFTALQIFDIVSTLLFIALGIEEGNPLLRLLAPHVGMVVALFLVKMLGVTLALIWYKAGRSLTRINYAFSGLILWNAVAVFVWLHGARYCDSCWF